MTLVRVTVGLLLLVVLVATTLSYAQSGDDPSFTTFLQLFEQGTTHFINGDPALWKQNASRRDEATLMGGWGTYERGWTEVGARYDWAAGRFEKSGAAVKVEYLASGVSGDLAYTVAIERSQVRLVGQTTPSDMALRVTHVFRKEGDSWKMVHRHADPLIATTTPASVLKK